MEAFLVYSFSTVHRNSNNGHWDGLVDSCLDVPARGITRVRKPGVDTGDGLLGVLLIDFVAGLAALFRDGEKTHGLQGFQGIRGSRMDHSDAKPEIVAAIDNREGGHEDNQSAFGEDARSEHADDSFPHRKCIRLGKLADRRGVVLKQSGRASAS